MNKKWVGFGTKKSLFFALWAAVKKKNEFWKQEFHFFSSSSDHHEEKNENWELSFRLCGGLSP